VTVAERSAGLLTIDLGTGQHFDPSSTGAATGLTYSSGTPAASQSATVDLGQAGNVSTLQADLTGDALVLGPIINLLGGLGNVNASAGAIRVTGLDTSHASAGNVDLRAAGDLTVGSPVLPYGAVLDTGMGTLALAADVSADGSGNNGAGTLTVQPGSVVVSENVGSGAITLRGAAAHLGTSAGPALVGARSVLRSTVIPFVTTDLAGPTGLAFDANGDLYVTNYDNNTVSRVAAGTSTATPFVTAGLDRPLYVAFDANGDLYVANPGNGTVSIVPAGTSTATPFVTGLSGPVSLAFDASGNLYVANQDNNTVSIVPAGDPTHTMPFVTAGLDRPRGLAFDASGNLYVANYFGNTVSKVAAGTNIATPFVTAGLSRPWGLAFDASDNLYVSNEANNTVCIVPAGSSTATTIVTSGPNPQALAFDASGNLYVANYAGNTVSKVAATTSPPVAGGVVVRSSLPGRPMLLGDTSSPVDGINLSSPELADIQTTATGTLTFGDASQTGDITFRTAQPATPGASLVVSQAPAGFGRIVLDDASAGTALDGNGGSVRLAAGAGGVVAANPGSGLFEIANAGAVGIETGGTAGTLANPLHLAGASLAVHAAGGLTAVTQVSQLAADGGSGGVSILNAGDLSITSVSSLAGVTAAGGVFIRATGDLLVNANVTSTGAGNILLQGDGSLTVAPAATVRAGAGVIQLFAGFGVFGTNSVLNVNGASLVASAVLMEVGVDSAVTIRFVPGGTTPITLDGGGNGLLDVNDAGDATAQTWTVTDNTITWGGPTLRYADLAALSVEGGSGGNTFNIATTSATAATLVGGSGGDTFRFADGASLGGSIVGGAAATLDYSAYTTSVVVDLQTGLATGVGGAIGGILTVIGGSGTPASSGVYNLLIGSGGNTLQGGTGRRNILVAGGSASTLAAGDGEDLLIAGSTAYDTDPALTNWLAIANYWAGSDPFATRAANLASGAGVPLLDPTVVTGNGGGNVLTGRGGLGLIFTDGLDTISGFDPNSQQVAINP
jgi:sugar lactone lactonase YvrE